MVTTESAGVRRVLAAWPYALILTVGIFVLIPALGEFGFWDPWEPKYAESAREMNERDTFVVPYYRQDIRLTKPILVYWGILAGTSVFGMNEFGARIVGVLMALLSMVGVYYAINLLRGRMAGLVSALVLGTAPHFYFISRQAMPDVYMFTSLGSCLIFFCLGLFGPDRRRNLHFAVSYACFGLAVLAKGPVIAGSIFLATILIYALIQIDPRELWLPGRRAETLLAAGTVVPAAVVLAGLSLTAFFFGTSPEWWGYSEGSREDAAIFRMQFVESFTRFHLAEILLVLLAVGGVLIGYRALRSGLARRRSAVIAAVTASIGAVSAVVTLFAGDQNFRILIASILGMLACTWAIWASIARLLSQEWLWPTAQPYVTQIRRQILLFAAVFAAVAGPWHAAIVYHHGHGYFTDFILKHNVTRFSEEINSSGVSEFYARVLIFGFFPWSCFIPAAIASLVNWWDRNPLKRYSVEAYLLIASVVTFTVFTSSATKFAHYLAPILLPTAVLIGLVIARSMETRNTIASRLTWLTAFMLFLLPTRDLLREGGIDYLVGAFTMKRYVPDALAPGAYYESLLIGVGLFLLASVLVRSRILLGGLLLCSTLAASYIAGTFIPALSTHKSMKKMCETWKARAPDGDPPICFYGDMKHGIFFYTEHRIFKLRKRAEFENFTAPDQPAFCIIERENLQPLQRNHRRKHPGEELVVADGSHFDYVLIANFPQPVGTVKTPPSNP